LQLTTLNEDHRRVSISRVREELLDRQAAAIGLPVIKVWLPSVCPHDVYEERMAATPRTAPLAAINYVGTVA